MQHKALSVLLIRYPGLVLLTSTPTSAPVPLTIISWSVATSCKAVSSVA